MSEGGTFHHNRKVHKKLTNGNAVRLVVEDSSHKQKIRFLALFFLNYKLFFAVVDVCWERCFFGRL